MRLSSHTILTASALVLAVPFVITSSLAQNYIPFLFASTSRLQSSESSKKEPKDGEDKDKDTNDSQGTKPKKRYDTKKEFYHPQHARWVTREEVDKDAVKEYLFTVADREWPKSQDWAGSEDYVSITLHSQCLTSVLRSILTESEEVLSDEPSLDARELFLARESITAALVAKKAELLLLERTEAEKDRGELDTKEGLKKEEEPVSPAPTPAVLEEKLEQVKIVDGADEEAVAKPESSLETLRMEADHLGVLVEFMDDHFSSTISKLDRLLADSSITYALLWAIFPQNCLVETTDELSEQRIAFRVRDASYVQSRDGPCFSIGGKRIVWTGSRYSKSWIYVRIPTFKGMRKLSGLSVKPITEKHAEELKERGRLYVGLSKVAFLNYSGVLVQVTGCGMDRRVIKLRAEGRAVVDTKSYRRMNPSGARELSDAECDEEDDLPFSTHSQAHHNGKDVTPVNTVSEENLCLLPPTVYGFSLVVREWGEMRVDQFSPVVFSNAWDHLVLDPSYKDLIRSLVGQHSSLAQRRALTSGDQPELCALPQNGPDGVTDVISGKGGGLVIVLHGKPGVGKTLTAEAVAELLQVPLYSVGAGELGTQAAEVENKLRDTLTLSTIWGAILLIDEADVFLEERSMHDLVRNAMVSVFLRTLEYHSGILFLTTNRLRAIDEAFLSRFSVALTYENLNLSKRLIIWKSFLNLAGVSIESSTDGTSNGLATPPTPAEDAVKVGATVSLKYLNKIAAKTNFNGRSIKNCVRTALSLANSHQVPLSSKELDIVINAFEQFSSDFKEPDVEGVYEVKGEGWKDRANVYG